MSVPNDLIDNKLALVQIMAWHHKVDEASPEPMMDQFTDTYMHCEAFFIKHLTSLCLCSACDKIRYVFANKQILMNNIISIFYEIVLSWMLWDLTDDWSTLV